MVMLKLVIRYEFFVAADDVRSYMEEKQTQEHLLKASCVMPFEVNVSLLRTEIVKA